MKFRTSLTTSILALAAILLASSAHADYVDGDVFLGFRATSGTGNQQSILIDVGNFSRFTTATTTPFTLNLNILNDLDTVFGSSPSWNSLSTVKWGAIGYDPTTSALYNTKAEVTLGVHPSGNARRSANQQDLTGAKLANMKLLFNTDLHNGQAANGGTSTFAVIENSTDTNASTNYWGSSANTPTYGVNGWNIEGNFGGGTGAAAAHLDFYSIPPGSTGTGTYVGTFSIDNGGNVTFVGINVPEPTSAVLFGLGVLGLLARRRHIQGASSGHRASQSICITWDKFVPLDRSTRYC